MVSVMCLVQEGQTSLATETGLKARIGEFTQSAFSAPADIDWIVVPTGAGFTGAAPARSVIVSLCSNHSLSQNEHVALLKELSELCAVQTRCSIGDVTAIIRNTKE